MRVNNNILKNTSLIKGLLLVLLLLTINYFAVGCSKPNIGEAQLSRHIDTSNRPIDVTNVFQMDDENIYCSFKLTGVNSSTILTIEFILVDTGFNEVAPITWYSENSTSPLRSGYSTITIPRTGKFFPAGNNKVVLYLNGIKQIELPFKIEKPKNQDVIIRELIQSIQNTEEIITVPFQWTFNGMPFSLTLNVPDSVYKLFQSIDRISTSDITNYSVYVTNRYDDYAMKTLASDLEKLSSQYHFNLYAQLHFILSFVQGLDYVSDNATTPFDEYPKYPIQTLVEHGGDCEDTSILLASLYEAININTVLLILHSPDHCAVGVEVQGIPGFGVERDGIVYYYAETTESGRGHLIGEIPQSYVGQLPLVAEFNDISHVQFRQFGKYSPYYVMGNVVQVTADIINIGSDMAKNVCIITGFDDENNQLLNEQRTRVFNLNPNCSAEAIFYLDIPYRQGNKLIINILQDGQIIKSANAPIEAYQVK